MIRSGRRGAFGAGVLLLSALTAGCAVIPASPHPPIPPPRAEFLPPRGQPGEVPRLGHWHWDGQAYRWIPAQWVPRPASGSRFVPGSWRDVGGQWAWVPGHWI